MRHILALTAFSLLTTCTSSTAIFELNIADAVSFTIPSKETTVKKQGDSLVISMINDQSLIITEAFSDALPNTIADNSYSSFMDQVFADNTNQTKYGTETLKFKTAIEIGGYHEKSKFSKNHFNYYIWNLDNNRFLAIISDNNSKYYIQILGINTKSNKFL